MDYKFPVDITLDQVKEEIKDSEEFKVTVKDNFTVVNYVYATADSFDTPLKAELRGLIFDNETGLVINRRFHKFFNVGERVNAEDIDISKPHVILEKLDGSMVSPILIDGNIRWITKMGHSDVALKAEAFCADKPKLLNLAKMALKVGKTPIFEYTAPHNRIVVDYGKEDMTLLAMRNNNDGTYHDRSYMATVAGVFDVPLVSSRLSSKDLVASVETIKNQEDGEGVVIQFEDGHMVKIKADWYVKLHKAKEVLSNEKNLIALFLDDKLDDVLPLLNEEDKVKLQDKQKLFWHSVNYTLTLLTVAMMNQPHETRKDFALEFVPTMPKCTRPWLFKKFEDNSPSLKEFIVFLRNSLNTRDRINQNRMLIGGHKYV